jgi:divalent metal cation (Fe/Co/Zn/Cd) transporter
MIETILLNLVKNLVVSEATDLVGDTVQQAIDDNLDEDQKQMLDKAVEAMPNDFKNIKDLLS